MANSSGSSVEDKLAQLSEIQLQIIFLRFEGMEVEDIVEKLFIGERSLADEMKGVWSLFGIPSQRTDPKPLPALKRLIFNEFFSLIPTIEDIKLFKDTHKPRNPDAPDAVDAKTGAEEPILAPDIFTRGRTPPSETPNPNKEFIDALDERLHNDKPDQSPTPAPTPPQPKKTPPAEVERETRVGLRTLVIVTLLIGLCIVLFYFADSLNNWFRNPFRIATKVAISPISTSAITSSAILFEDNFDKGLKDNWKIICGEPILANEKLLVDINPPKNEVWLAVGDTSWKNYAVILTVLDFPGSGKVGIGVRYKFGEFLLGTTTGIWTEFVDSPQMSCYRLDKRAITGTTIQKPLNIPGQIEIDVIDNTVLFLANGAKVTSYVFSKTRDSGKVLLYLTGGTTIDDFKIVELP